MKIKSIIRIYFFLSILIASEKKEPDNYVELPTFPHRSQRIGDYPFPSNPMTDRARGYLLQGKVKNAIQNNGNFINWDDQPSGLWGDYTYLPAVSFLAGVPGQVYSNKFLWEEIQENVGPNNTIIKVFGSTEAYEAWIDESGDTVFVGIVFDYKDDRGTIGSLVESVAEITNINQWYLSADDQMVYLGVEFLESGMKDPNKPGSRIGLMYPWGMRPALLERGDDFDIYNYGEDKEEWTKDDEYAFYGATVQESWFTRLNPSVNTEWQASTLARINTHATTVSAGDIFGNTVFTDPDDPYPLLAHSNFSETWPMRLNETTGLDEGFWPGWWAEDYLGDLPMDEWPVGCSGDRADDDCWETVPGRFISDSDVYLEFDDRWAQRGNLVSSNDEYLQTGYPLGLRVMAEAHSYGVAYAEDIMFVTVKVRNESGDWTDENGFHDGMIMPDGTKLNRGKGFNYRGVYLGFYMDADVLSTDIYGNFGVHTNDDDFMRYYDCLTDTTEPCEEVNGQKLRVSMATIEDKDWNSNGVTNLGMVATQLLDSPLATDEIDLNLDGITDIYPGEKLKMTDWHWFDWYTRPGVVSAESNGSGCFSGDRGCPQALNKEEILMKIISGDTTNLSSGEKQWHFHTEDEETDLDINLNPHFDSLDGLEDAFPDGLDCVLIMSCGPFDFPVGEEVPFSFCVIFGQNFEDLKSNAKFAQIMYNSHYQGYTPPSKPNVTAKVDQNKVTLYWDDNAESSRDVVTGYADFEGYKIYKSISGGSNWGKPDKKVLDDTGVMVGWRPEAQFDLSAHDDSVHCIYSSDECTGDEARGVSISGPDPSAPWFSLGNDTGLDAIRLDEPIVINGREYNYYWEDENVQNGLAYTYSVTSYDIGIAKDYSISWIPVDSVENGFDPDTVWSSTNPDNWSSPYGYSSIETSKGTTVLDPNFVTVFPGPKPAVSLDSVKVVPNPYIVHSRMNETEVVKKIRFTHLPPNATIKIFTVTGEYVNTIHHSDSDVGAVFWNLRTENNQEIAPGLYIYVVESGSKKHVGKFAVVR